MSTIQELFQQAQLAEAAYANFAAFPNNPKGALEEEGFSAAQATNFVAYWRVVSQFSESGISSNGFSAALFERVDANQQPTGQYTFAIRGSTEFVDFFGADLDLAATGVAHNQLVSMLNYVLRLQVGENGTTKQLNFDGTELTSNFVSGVGPGIDPAQLTISGHSLGGYLAQVYQRIFKSAGVYTYNALGLTRPNDPIFDRLTNLLGLPTGSFSSGPGENLLVPGEPAQLIGTVQGKPQILVFTEKQSTTIDPINTIPAHKMGYLTDSLAVYNLLATLDPSLNTANPADGLAKITEILSATSNVGANTLESLISDLGKLFSVSGTAFTGNEFDTNRDKLYTSLSSINQAITGKSGLHLVSLTGTDTVTIEANAFADIAYRYALRELNPFAIVGDASIYSQHNANGQLDIYNSATESGALTSQWISDRAEMLSWTIVRNNADIEGIIRRTDGGESKDFVNFAVDSQTGKVTKEVLLVRGGTSLGKLNLQPQVAFGSSNDDGLNGSGFSDKFYGGDGKDTLIAQGGDDYLEGGQGDDLLNGGFGNDTYMYLGKEGDDTIVDADGVGKILYAGRDLSGAKTLFNPAIPNVYSDGAFTYRAYTHAQNTILTVTKDSDPSGKITVQNFRNGDLGITLDGTATPPPTTSKFGTDEANLLAADAPNQNVFGLGGNDRITIAFANASGYGGLGTDVIRDGNGDQKFYGEDGNDALIAIAGYDELYGGLGNDALQGGADSDYLEGNDGDDALDGGAGGDTIYGGAGADFILGGGSLVPALPDSELVDPSGPNWGMTVVNGQMVFTNMAGLAFLDGDEGDYIDGGAGNDWIAAGEGDDYVDGGADDDLLVGISGNDTLFGGTGNDTLYGDGTEGSITFLDGLMYTLPASHGADYLDGGEGNDNLTGDGGADTLLGGIGDDTLIGDDSRLDEQYHGADYLDGGDGNDRLIGYGKDDMLFGGAGDDRLDGDSSTIAPALHGNDYLDGGDGNDDMTGSGGSDTLFGGAGNDQLFGDTDDTPLAYQGGDYLDGEEGNDYLRGYGGNDELFGGEGNDQLLAEAGDDYLDGEAGDDILDAGDGNDTLFGGAGADQLSGGAGDDTLDGGAGADTLAGGAGNDTYLVDMTDTVNDTEGNNRIIFATNVNPDALQIIPVSYNGVSGLGLSAGGAASGDPVPSGLFLTGTPQTQNFQFQFDDGTVLSQAELYGSRYFGNQFLAAGDNGEVLNGGAGNDTLIGGAGADTLYGWDGNDNLDGGAGQDTLVGGRGNDEVRGGNGSDTYVFARGGGQDTVVDAGDLQSIDVLQLTDVLPSDVTLERMANGDLQIRVNGTDDRITVQGQYTLAGNRIEQIMFADGSGLGAVDLQALQVAPITGTPQDDALAGTPYDDTLLGLAGNDTLDGGAGNDRLEGGAGDDTYVFDYGMGSDTLFDADGRIILQTGLGFDNLRATPQGNDLLLAIRGTGQGALLKDYSVAPQNWVIQNSAGAQTNPEVILQATAQAAQNTVQSAWDDHASAYRAEIIARYQADGHRMGADGVLRRSPAFNDTVTAGVVQGAATTTRVVSLLSGGGSTSTFTTPINDFTLGAPFLLQGTATIPTVTTAADDPEIFARFPALTESFTDEDVLASITWNQASLTETETLSVNTSSSFLYGPPDPESITGGNTVIGSMTDTVVTRVFGGTVNGTVTAVLPLGAAMPQSGFYPEVINARITYRQSVETIEEIRGGPGNNTISFDGANSLLVDAGAGDDVVRWSGLSAASGRGNFLYGNAGADELSGGPANDVLVGGTENDTLDGGSGADTYLIVPEDGGFDLIDDTANTVIRAPEIGNFSKYSEWYYRGLGIEDFHSRMAGFGPPLPPLPQIAANNYTALAPLYAAGLIETDTVEFAAGISLADLQFSWGQYQKPMPPGIPLTPGGSFGIPTAPDPADFLFTTLDISWAPDGGARLVIPRSESPADFSTFANGATLYTGGALGVGVEQFRFADGTVLSIEQMLNRAPPAPTFDPQLLREFLFQPGMGVQTADTAIESVRFAAGIQPEDVTVTRAGTDLLLTYNNGADALRVPDWYSDPASIPSLSAMFDSGTTWDAATLTAHGLVMHGTANADTLTGLSPYSNVLIGGPGNDTLVGGTGDDTYVFDLGDGIDRISDPGGNNALQFGSGITPDALSLGIGSLLIRVGTGGDAVHLENFDPNDVYGPHAIENFQFADGTTLTYAQLIDRGFDLQGTEGNDILSGTNVVDRIRGAGGDDVIAGGAGNDELFGGAGNDTYVFGLGDGLDTIHDAAASGAENLIEFGAGVTRNDLVLEHEGDTLTIHYGAAGDAIRLPDFNAHDVNGTVVAATLKFADGSTASLAQLANRAPTLANTLADQDAIEDAPFSLQVPANAFVDVDVGDTLTYTATLADGSALPGWLTFEAATRTFSGTPVRADVGTLNVKVMATDSGNLSASDIFGLTVAKIPGQILIGTAGNDVLTGGGGDDTLDGRGGSDRLLGNGGDDTFQFFADAKWTGKFVAHNEGSPGNPGTGRNAAIAGKNRSHDVFQGGPGTDVLFGTGGDDALFLDDRYSPFPSGREARLSGIERIEGGNGSDVIDLTSRDYGYGDVTLDGGEGNDVLWASGGNDILLGGPGNDELFGGAGNDTLNGDAGADTMIGGAGNDTYFADNARDVITENTGAGVDTVLSSINYTLGNNVENLTLTGGSNINGTGNKLNNAIIGNSAANTLNGGAGTDTMSGGAGDDTYIVDNASDVVTENAGEGFDTINSSVTRTISANVEKLVLTGTSAIHGTGSTDDDYILGNNAKNTLTGGAGNDLLNGGAGHDTLKGDAGNDVLEGMKGNDTLADTGGNNLFNGGAGGDTMTGNTGNELFIGGAGNDTITTNTGADIIVFNRGDGQDTINASAGADNTLSIGGGIRYADMTFTRKSNNLVLNLRGGSEKITLTNWYASSPANKSVLNLQVIAQAMADFNASSADPLLNKRIANFDFLGLASAFDAAGAPANWALTHALLAEHLSGSDTEALGGDLAYRYGLIGSLANVGFDPAVSILSNASFGTAAQAFQSQAALEQGIKRLS